MERVAISRQEIYDLVWSESILSLSTKHKISASAFRKICTDMKVPIPKAGHWQKLKFGKSVVIEALPSDYTGKQEVTIHEGDGKDGYTSLESPLSILQKEIENDSSLKLVVPLKLTNPDKLIISAKNDIENKKGYDGWIHSSRNELSINVTSQNISRALRFMDTFIKLLHTRGHDIRIDSDKTYAVVNGQKVELNLREKRRRELVKTKYSWMNTVYHPTGIFLFTTKISYRYEMAWTDGKLLIENQLSKILAKIEIKAQEYKEEQLRWQKEREKQEEIRRIQLEFEKRKEDELSKFKNLLQEAHRWRQIKVLRNYINEVEEAAISDNRLADELEQWLSWARKKVDWYDPYVNGEDELLKEVDKESLNFKKKGTSFY